MQIQFNFKSFEPSNHLKQYAENRFSKLEKYIQKPESADLQINLEVEKFRQKAEIVLVAKDLHFSAAEESEDMYSTIDLTLDKMEAQLRKHRDKVKTKRRGAKSSPVRTDIFSYSEDDSGKRERTIVRTDSYVPKPMSVDEAAMQLDTLKYDFLVFLDSDTDRTNVIYRRKNGDFGLIDPGL